LEHRWEAIPDICKSCPDWQAVGAIYHKNQMTGTKKEARPFWWSKKLADD
jgi:hypothetical protein